MKLGFYRHLEVINIDNIPRTKNGCLVGNTTGKNNVETVMNILKETTVKKENNITYQELIENFIRCFPDIANQIIDYRPCDSMFNVPNISGAIVIWLSSGQRIIYTVEGYSLTDYCSPIKFERRM